MSFLAAKKASPQTAAIWPAYTGLQLQTATNTLPIPLVWGMRRHLESFRVELFRRSDDGAVRGG